MQRAALAGSEAAALFLATHGAKVNHVNKWVCLNMRGSRAVLIWRVGPDLAGTADAHDSGLGGGPDGVLPVFRGRALFTPPVAVAWRA